MTHVEHSILINQPIDQVYSFVSNPRNDPQWQAGIIKIHGRRRCTHSRRNPGQRRTNVYGQKAGSGP